MARFRSYPRLFVRSPSGAACPIPGRPGHTYPSDSLTPVANDRVHRVLIGDGSLVLDMQATRRQSAQPARPVTQKKEK